MIIKSSINQYQETISIFSNSSFFWIRICCHSQYDRIIRFFNDQRESQDPKSRWSIKRSAYICHFFKIKFKKFLLFSCMSCIRQFKDNYDTNYRTYKIKKIIDFTLIIVKISIDSDTREINQIWSSQVNQCRRSLMNSISSNFQS